MSVVLLFQGELEAFYIFLKCTPFLSKYLKKEKLNFDILKLRSEINKKYCAMIFENLY